MIVVHLTIEGQWRVWPERELLLGHDDEGMKEGLLDPEWKGSPRVEVLADTTLDFKKSNEMVRIDVNGNYAVAISRIERAWNDTTKNARTRSG